MKLKEMIFTIIFTCFILPLAVLGGEKTPIYSYRILNVYPHDVDAYTQGLVYDDGVLYEGTGLNEKSTLRMVDLKDGTVLQYHELAPEYFGEGVTIFGDRIIQLTWKANTGFYYDKASFILIEQFYYPTEGWGLTHDGKRLIMSDGSDVIRFLIPETFEEVSRISVTDHEGPVSNLNELEYINGEIFANVWPTDRIVKINPLTGKVTAWIDLTGLLKKQDRNAQVDVLNGIAYDAERDRLFVTGKHWPKLFEIELVAEDAE